MSHLSALLLAIPLLLVPAGCAPASATSSAETPVTVTMNEINKQCFVEIFYDGKKKLHEIPLQNCETK